MGATLGILIVETVLLDNALTNLNGASNTSSAEAFGVGTSVAKALPGERRSLEVKRPLSATGRPRHGPGIAGARPLRPRLLNVELRDADD